MSNQITNHQERILKLAEVKKITGLSGSSIYRLASQGKFPKPTKIGARASGWPLSSINEWVSARIEDSAMEGTHE